MMRSIDLNADLGEGYGPWSMGDDTTMLGIVTSANIACGGHAGDPDTMFNALSVAGQNNVVVGAHPGYADRAGFGRRIIPMSPDEMARMIAAQIGALTSIARLAGVEVRYVKAHGALANLAASDAAVARVLVDTVRQLDERLAILAISGTEIEHAARKASAQVFSEVFADRGYQASGQLVPRTDAADRLLGFLETGLMPVVDGAPIPLAADSICVHGDSPGAVDMTTELRSRLLAAGVELRSFAATS
jgi:UPF0271 protein